MNLAPGAWRGDDKVTAVFVEDLIAEREGHFDGVVADELAVGVVEQVDDRH